MFKNSILSFCFYNIIIIIIILNSNFVIESVKSSLFICYSSIIPSLFVFMVLSSLIANSSAINIFSIFFSFYLNLLKINSKKASAYFFLSIFSGFVVGSRFLNNLHFNGFSENSLKVLSILFCQNSFSFIIFVVGINILNNLSLAFLIFLSLLFSSIITAFLFSFKLKYDYVKDKNATNQITFFPEIIKSNVNAILNICGFVIIFYLVCDFISLYISSPLIKSSLLPFIEITSNLFKNLNNQNPYFIIFSLSIFPIATLSQIAFFAKKAIDIKFLIASRFIHTPLSIFILKLFLNIFPYTANVYNSNSLHLKTHWISADISIILFLISFIFVLFLEENKRFTNYK